MQNEETPTEVNPFLEIASSMYQKPAQPVAQPDNPFMELAPSMRALSQPPAIGSLSAVMGINPDQAAEATKLGKPLGIGQDLGLRNMEELRRRSMIASVQRSGMLQNNPRFAESLLDPVFAAQAHDDLDSLNKTSSLFDKVVSVFDAPNWMFGFKTVAEVTGGVERGLGTVERGELGSKQMFGSATPEQLARLEVLDKKLGAIPPGGIVSMTAEVVAQQLATIRSVGTTALIGAGVGAAVSGPAAPVGAAGGFLAGGAAGLMATTTQTEAGNLYRDMVNQGVDPDTAQYAALTGGLLNGIIELAGAKIAAGPFKALASKYMKEAVGAAVAKPTARAAMAIAGKEYAKQVGTETAEEVGQELVAITTEEIAKAMDGIDSETSFKDAMTRLVDAGIAGFQGSLVLGGIGPTSNFVVDLRRAEATTKQQEFFDGLDAAKRDGKLPKRNLDAYEGFLARQAKGTTADTVYVEAEAAAQVLAQSGLSAEQLEQSIPGIREQLRNALENGGDVTIPTSVYGARLAGTPLGDALRPHVRLSPEAMSVAQAQEFSRKRDALRQEAQAALAERQEADAAFVESAQKVETTVADQLRQTGMQDIEVRANAELFRDLAVTQAARMGITPEQFYERYPYRVRGPQAVQEGQPLKQARREPAPEKGVFNANNPPADVTAEGSREAIMAVMDYEGKIYYDRAATMHGDLLDSFPELDADLIIDGGFIRDGKYIPNMSDGGFAAIEGGRERLALVKAFANKANQRAGAVDAVAQIDIDYLDAVERGDMETAQRMVDEAARASGLTEEVWRGDSRFDITEYAERRRNEPGIFTTYDQQVAKDYANDGEVRRFYVGGKTLDLASRSREAVAWIQEWAKESGYDFIDRATGFEADPVEEYFAGDMWDFEGNGTGARWKDIQRTARAQGYDIVRLRDSHYSQPMTSVVVLNENNIKLADPVVYDEAGNVVPLSRRFDITSPKVFEQAGRIDAETQSINEAATAVSDDVLKAESQPEIPQAIDNVAALDEVGRLATGQTWAKGRDLKEEMQNRVLSLAANAGVNLSLDTPQTTEYLTRIGYRDALYALRQNPNSVGWYDEKTRQAIAVMALVHPELLTDENARFAFTWALAVTSNGIKVDKNFELADSVYRTYKATGKMPTNLTAGQAQAAINRSLGMFNELRDAWGIDNLRRFAQTEYTIQELRYIVDDFDAGGEFAETTVKGAGILGPKIGNGFFSNLYGDFRSLTMDRWLIRTWGRWTGTLIKEMPVQTQNARTRLGKAVEALNEETRITIASILRNQIPESQEQQRGVIDALAAGEGVDLDVLSTVIQKASMDKEARAALNESMSGQEIRKSGNSLAKYLDGQKEAPAGPGERVQIRSVFASILQELQKLPEYSDLTMADLQAALWYAEKRLYETAKEDIQVDEESIEGYADDEAPDYANAASNVARSSGVSEQRIQATLAKESNSERSRRARLEDEQGKPIDARDQGPVGGFTAKEKRSFNGAAVIRNHRASRGGNAGQPGTYQRSGSKADAKPRLVKKLGARVVAKFNVSTRLRNALKAAGGKQRPFSAPSFLELEQGDISAQAFHKLITDSKQKNAYGASVYAYPVDDYASMRLFVTEDLQSGFALKPDGDIVSVFSMSDSGAGHAIVQMAVSQGGRKLDAFETVLPYLYAPHGFRVVSRLRWDESQKPDGWDKQIFKEFNNGEPDVVFMVYDPTYYGQHSKNDKKVATSYDAAVRAQTREVKKIAQAGQFQQAMPSRAPRGDFDPAKLMTTLREGRDFSTFAHETAHFYLTILADIARSATGPQQTKADMDALLSWFGIEGATPAERLAKWSSLTIDQQRQYHEQFAYSFEIYLHEGKAPSVEMQSLFNQFAAWLKRVYKSIRDELNATYKAQFGRDLPMMSSEIRLVMDRMLATDEQIARAQAVRGMKAMFQTQEQSGMNDAEWAAYQALEQDATDAATAELTKATLRELQWYGNAQSKYLREIQSKHDRARKEIREEVSAQVQLEPVYRAIEFLKRGTIRTDTGEVTAATGAFKLDLAKVRAIMPAGFDPATLKYGKYGMVQEGGIDPDMAAGMFGYGSGVELINAILGAKPIKEEIDARTDQRMLDENSDLATPEARQAAVDMAIHNEARARFIAVEQRWLEKQRRPANDMLQAARQVAQDIIGGVVIRTLNPRRYEAAEAEAARTATTAYREPQDPSTAGQAAATRAYNEAISAGQTPDEATVAATEAGVAAVAKAQERRADFNAKYGGREPAEVARRAKRQQLVQNQLAREAMLAKEEIAVAGRDFRKFFRSDEKLAKTRDMAPIMAARAILSYYGYGKRGESPAQYLDQLRTYAPDLYDGIAPIVLKSLSGTTDYRDLTVTEFRVLRDTVQALWAQARRDRQITVEGERVALDVILKEMADRLQAIGVGERVGQRQAPGAFDQANRHLLGLRAMMSRVEAWADALDGMAGPGAFTKYLFRPVKQAVDAYRIERNKYVERFVKLLDGIDLPVGKIAAPELDYTFGNGNGGIGRAELLGALMHTGNEGNYRKLLLGRGWGELDADGNLDDSRWRSFVARMIAEGKLTKADYDFVQSIWDLLEEIKPLAQRAHFDMYGYYFKEVEATEVVTPFGTYRGGYVPAATDKFMVQDARVNASMDELEGDWRNSLPSTGAGFTKGRVDYNEALSLDLRLIATHTDAVLRFSMIQPSVKDALKILRDRDLKALLERFDPAVMENMLLPWLNRAARQQATEPGRWKLADKFWGGVRSRAGVATMFANLRNALQQVTGWFPSLLKVKRRYLQSALMTYLGSPKQTAEAVARLSPFMADRMRNQMFELQGTMNELLLNPSKYEKLQQWSSKHGYFLQQAFQNMVDVTTWQGAYNQALAEGETQAEAVARGDAAVRLTQGSLSPEDLSMFEVGTPFYRTFVQFTGYFNMLANLNLGEFQKTVRDMGWRSGKGRLLYIYVMGMLLPAIVSDSIVRSLGGGWDDEDEDGYMDVFMDWFFGSQVRMGAALLPFGSTAYTAITTAFNDKPYDDRITTSPSIAALESATIGTSKAIIAVTDEDKDVTGRNVRDVLTLITLLTGVPVSALGRPAGYLVDVERGEIEPESGYDMIRGMITGTATPESKR
jgi:hypothetical protein